MTDCPLCLITQGSIPSTRIFEDDTRMAVLDVNGCAAGHCFVLPKQHYPIMNQVPPELLGELFDLANKVSTALFEGAGSQGTNLFVCNGTSAGQRVPHFMIQVLPRHEGDGVDLTWKPRQLSEEEMSMAELLLKQDLEGVETTVVEEPPAPIAPLTGLRKRAPVKKIRVARTQRFHRIP